MGKDDFRKIPGGLNGVEQRGILLFDACQNKKLKIERMCALISENPAKLFGLWDRKGFIKEGYDADIVIIDPETLEISFMIRAPCLTFIELEKDTLALIKRVEYGKNQIL